MLQLDSGSRSADRQVAVYIWDCLHVLTGKTQSAYQTFSSPMPRTSAGEQEVLSPAVSGSNPHGPNIHQEKQHAQVQPAANP